MFAYSLKMISQVETLNMGTYSHAHHHCDILETGNDCYCFKQRKISA